jgi:CRP-like cAMP-binding protein
MAENNLRSVAFPTLNEAQIDELARCTNAAPRLFHAGEALFTVGQRNISFFIVKSGEVEIIDRSGDEPKTVTIHRAGHFTGDVSHLTGLPAVVSAIALGDCEVLEISSEALHRRHHPPGLHRAAAASARVAQLHGSAGNRVPLLARHFPRSRFPGQEPHPLHLGRRRNRAGCGQAA